jgi:hypothetical protein
MSRQAVLWHRGTVTPYHPHFPLERRRPHVEPFAAHPLTDGTSLIPRDALLDAMEDDDDIEWSENPFDQP